MPRIPVESKHTYASYNGLICGASMDSQIGADNFNANRPLINGSIPRYPIRGTDEQNRIGRKIRTDSLVSEFFINLYNTLDYDNFNTIYDYYTAVNANVLAAISSMVDPDSPAFNTNEQNLDVSIRHLIVEFDRDFLLDFEPTNEDDFIRLYDWFWQLSMFTGTYGMHSNRQQVKRESTEYTGSFSILYDKVIHLSLRNPIYHGNVSIPYVRHLNFDGESDNEDLPDLPSNKVVIQFFVGPTNIFIDYGNFNLGQYISNRPPDAPPNIIVAEISNSLKLSYTDL